MKVSVKIYGALQTVLGAERLEIEMPSGASVQAVLEELASKLELNGTGGVWDTHSKKFCIPLIAMVDNEDVRDFSMPLEDQQVIVLVTPMEGG